jgi:predicted branched-subunit amino acid permease
MITARPPFTRRGLARGARQALPLAASNFAFGLIFGTLAQGAGLRLAETALMSATVVAGAAQFVVIGLWTTPPAIAGILAATLLVNLRHLLLGATLRPWFANSTAVQTYGSAFVLFDESWALTHREAGPTTRCGGCPGCGGCPVGAPGERDRAFLLGCGGILWLAWIVSSVLGYVAAGWVPDPTRLGLDFAATAVFIALLTGMWRGRGDLLPWLVAALVAYGAARWLPGQWYIVLGGLAGSLCGMWRDAE